MSLKSGSSAFSSSTSSTRATTPGGRQYDREANCSLCQGNHPSLLKARIQRTRRDPVIGLTAVPQVSLQKDVHRPVSPKMGGSFLDLPLAGRGIAGKPSRGPEETWKLLFEPGSSQRTSRFRVGMYVCPYGNLWRDYPLSGDALGLLTFKVRML